MRRISLIATLLAVPVFALAMEGMWLPDQVPQLSKEIKGLGWEGDPAVLGQVGGPVLGAVVDMGYCSAAFVSPDGLIATAYHCVTDGLQYASRKGEDLFEDGFYAASQGEERWAGPTEHMRVTTGITDVTKEVLAGTKKLTVEEKLAKIDENIEAIVRRCEASGQSCKVAVQGGGTHYHLVTQLDLRDMRLVYAPPNAVGYFGEDRDNWQWPRHSGDFAFFRAYVAPDGKAAPHHPDNVPYKPQHWLKTATTGPKPGEFVGVAGFPAGTWRWRSAAELDYHATEAYPRLLNIKHAELAILERHARRDEATAAKASPRMLNLSNDVLYLEGQLAMFERLKTQQSKWQFEQDLRKWIAADPARYEQHGEVIDAMHRLQAEEAATGARDQHIDRMIKDVHLLNAAVNLYQLAKESVKPDKKRRPGFQNRDRPDIASKLDKIESTFDWQIDRDMLRWFLVELMRMPPGQRPPEIDNWYASLAKHPTVEATLDAELERLYKNGDLMDPEKRRSLMDTSEWFLTKSGNPWFALAAALEPHLVRQYELNTQRGAAWREYRPRYVDAVMAFYPEGRPRYVAEKGELAPGLFYPDANATLRVTVGKVDGFFPRDGLIAEPRTRLQGIAEKAGGAPYDIPEALGAAIASGEYGPYADPKLASVPVNFLSTLDTARGSSGSATFNAKGEFCGVIFDGNLESIASDWVFNEGLTRSIHTDVSYILWYLDRVAHADRVLEELGHKPAFSQKSAEAAAGDGKGPG
jgi:hypothetical protein